MDRISLNLQTDILVIGSGLAGICAAIQAARLGCSVILVEKYRTLGGNSGPEVGVHPSGAHRFHTFAAETGIIEEITEEAAWEMAKTHSMEMHYNISPQWDSVLSQKLREAGVLVLRCNYAKAVEMDGNRIKEVIVEDTETYHTRRIKIHVAVIESSGDGHIAKEAGAVFSMGREAQNEYNERSAPEKSDNITMGTSVVGLVRKTNHPVEFIPPAGTPPIYPGYGGIWGWDPPEDADCAFFFPTETGGQIDTIEDGSAIYDKALMQLYSAWNHIKNEKYQEQSKNWELIWIGPRAAKRESRRFIGDYVLTQNDVEAGKVFEDSVAYGGFALDVHHPRPEKNDYVMIVYYSTPPIYTIPYRCLYSVNIENLFLASRLISVTHMAHGTTRLQRTLATIGQAAGAAASLCKKYACSPRGIYKDHIKELQQLLLKEDATVLGVKNDDPCDIARSASVFATSETHFECMTLTNWLPLDCKRGFMLWDWGEKLDSVSCYMKNTSDKSVNLKATLRLRKMPVTWKESRDTEGFPYWKVKNEREWGDDNHTDIFAPVTESTAEIPGRFEGWVHFKLGQAMISKNPALDEERYLFEIEEHEGIEWARDENYYDFVRRIELLKDSEEYIAYPESHMFQLTPKPAYGEAANVIDGINRRLCSNPVHMWITEKGEPLPQILTLEWEQPKAFNQIQITFDTLYRAFREMPLDCEKRVSEMCIRDYYIQAWNGTEWTNLCEVKDNYSRMRRHIVQLTSASKLRILVNSIWGSEYTARIYEVRVYNL